MGIINLFKTAIKPVWGPPTDAFNITPSDTVDFTTVARCIQVGTPGTVAVVLLNDAVVSYKISIPGDRIIGFFRRVNDTGTTASDLVGEV